MKRQREKIADIQRDRGMERKGNKETEKWRSKKCRYIDEKRDIETAI